jgi:uncharacterized protein
MTLPVTDSGDSARFLVRVVAGIVGEGDHAALKIALRAPPVEGHANAAHIESLADMLSVHRADLAIAAGEHSRTRTLLVRGRSAAEIRKSLTASKEDEG